MKGAVNNVDKAGWTEISVYYRHLITGQGWKLQPMLDLVVSEGALLSFPLYFFEQPGTLSRVMLRARSVALEYCGEE